MGTISGLQPFSVRALLIACLQEHFWSEDTKEEGDGRGNGSSPVILELWGFRSEFQQIHKDANLCRSVHFKG